MKISKLIGYSIKRKHAILLAAVILIFVEPTFAQENFNFGPGATESAEVTGSFTEWLKLWTKLVFIGTLAYALLSWIIPRLRFNLLWTGGVIAFIWLMGPLWYAISGRIDEIETSMHYFHDNQIVIEERIEHTA